MNKVFLVKIANSIVMPMLCVSHWYTYFGAQVYLVIFEEASDAIAFERSSFRENHVIKVFSMSQ